MKTKNSMAVTALSRYGFNQLVGYTVPSWYGKGGWGTLGMLFSNHDNSSLAEAWYLNNQFILDETMTRFPKLMDVHFNSPDISGIKDDPEFSKGMAAAGYGMGKDQMGLIHDRDTVAFTETPPGSPAWTNPTPSPLAHQLERSGGRRQGIHRHGQQGRQGKAGCLVPQQNQHQNGHRHGGRRRHPRGQDGAADQRFSSAPGTGTQKRGKKPSWK